MSITRFAMRLLARLISVFTLEKLLQDDFRDYWGVVLFLKSFTKIFSLFLEFLQVKLMSIICLPLSIFPELSSWISIKLFELIF